MNKDMAPHYATNKQFFDSLLDNRFTEKDIAGLRKKWNKKTTSKISTFVSFNNEVKQLLKKYNIPLQWSETLVNYLMYGKKLIPLNEVLGVEIVDGRSGNKELVIRCTANTRIRDIKSAWGIVQTMQKRMFNFNHKTRPKSDKNRYRDKIILKMASRGKTVPEISKYMCERFLNFDLTEDGIRQVIKRNKQTFIVFNKNRA